MIQLNKLITAIEVQAKTGKMPGPDGLSEKYCGKKEKKERTFWYNH